MIVQEQLAILSSSRFAGKKCGVSTTGRISKVHKGELKIVHNAQSEFCSSKLGGRLIPCGIHIWSLYIFRAVHSHIITAIGLQSADRRPEEIVISGAGLGRRYFHDEWSLAVIVCQFNSVIRIFVTDDRSGSIVLIGCTLQTVTSLWIQLDHTNTASAGKGSIRHPQFACVVVEYCGVNTVWICSVICRVFRRHLGFVGDTQYIHQIGLIHIICRHCRSNKHFLIFVRTIRFI